MPDSSMAQYPYRVHGSRVWLSARVAVGLVVAPRNVKAVLRGLRSVRLVMVAACVAMTWMLPGPASSASADPLIFVSDEAYPPVSFIERGEPRGMAVDVARALEAKLGQPIDLRLMNWDTAQALVRNGTADAAAIMSITENRKAFYDFSRPIQQLSFSIFVRTSTAGLSQMSDLRGKKVGVTAGGLPKRLLEADPAIKLMLIDDYRAGFNLLIDRSLDAVVADQWVGGYVLAENGIEGIRISGAPLITLQAAIAVRKGNDTLLARIDAGLRALAAEGTLARIEAAWEPKQVVLQTREQLTQRNYLVASVVLALLLALTFLWGLLMRREIRRRHAIEASLRESEARIRAISDNLPGSMVYQILREPDGAMHFDYVGAGIEALHGLTAQQVMQDVDLLFRQIVEEDRPALYAARRASFESMSTFRLKVRRRAADGSIRWSQFFSSPRPLANGRVAWDGIELDVTDLHAQETARIELETKLRQAQKMESIGQLAGGIAHDFNNILGAIMGFNDLARASEATRGDPWLASYLDEIDLATTRARDLVAQLLAFSRSDAGAQLDSILAGPVAMEVVKLLRSTLPSTLSITLDLADDLPEVQISAIQLHQILMNLCINARDATSGKGRIDVRVSRASITALSRCDSCHQTFSGEFVCVAVADDGRGVSAELLDKIFDPFFTTKAVGEGSGLGLSVLHGIVHAAGGHVEVNSVRGGGSTFRVYLPALHGPVALGKFGGAGERGASHINGHVLVVDDEQQLANFLRALLTGVGCQVSAFTDPQRALAAFAERPASFDLMICDQTMPGMSGTELVAAVHAVVSTLPVILCTGYSNSINADNAADHGIDVFLTKPVASADLLACVRRLLGQGAPT